MFRIAIALAFCLTLPACSISPPTSAFSSLNRDEDKSAEQATREARRKKPEETKEAGIGSSISGMWDSVKSGLSFSGDDESEPIDANVKVVALDLDKAASMVNSYRAENGLGPLRLSPQLSEAAWVHSKDLSTADRISHYGSDGSDALERVRRAGYQARLTAENVGTGQRSLSEVITGWKNSRDHNANLLLPDAEEMGIAMVYAPDTKFKTFWTMVVGSPIQVTN